jgi:basic amino acid/polyamine antiporter, APA family
MRFRARHSRAVCDTNSAVTQSAQAEVSEEGLVRAIGRWSLAALTINSILGSGIFGLPSLMVDLLGRLSPLAVILAGVAMAVIVGCYAEVASQFTQTGGTYLYTRAAFGRMIGLQVGWMTLLSRFTACAANVNLLVIYLGEFWPQVTQPLLRSIVITVLIGFLTVVNYRGVRTGTLVNNGFVIAKLLPLALICVVGGVYLVTHAAIPIPTIATTTNSWRSALLLMFFAYGGYEAALNPMGEAKNPRRDAAFALFAALGVVTVIYIVIQFVVVRVLPFSLHSERPLADAAQVFLGRGGAALVAVGALVSVYGYLCANLLTGPRGIFALAEQRDFPKPLGNIHPRFKTPHVSILVFAVLTLGLALAGSFTWNVTLSAVSRLFYYGAVCVALPVLRRKDKDQRAAWFRLPAGSVFAVIGVLICLVLLTGVDFSKSLILLATVAIALVNWFLVKQRASNGES